MGFLNKVITAILILFYLTSLDLYSQQSDLVKLNSVILNEDFSGLNKKSADYTERSFIEINQDFFEEGNIKAGSSFLLEVEKGVSREFIVTRSKDYIPGVKSFISNERGNQDKIFSFTYSKGKLNGLYHESHERNLIFGYDAITEKNYLTEKTESEMGLNCGIHTLKDDAVISQVQGKVSAEGGNTGYMPNIVSMSTSLEDSVTIDLMILYTAEAETWAASADSSAQSNQSYYGDIEGVIAQAMNLSQAALDNSNLGIELRLVHYYKTDYTDDETETTSNTHLERLRTGSDGHMDNVHSLRDDYGADVVAMLAHVNDTGGLGYVMNSSAGRPDLAFNLDRVQQVAASYTLIHEIGHNMGSAHSRTQNSSPASITGGVFHYSVGYQDFTNNNHTVMAYSQGGLQQAPLFSSPDLMWQGDPLGTNDPITPENNARSLAEVKRIVANYKLSETNPPLVSNSRNSINVEMNREDEQTEIITISNPAGESTLMWDTDFEFYTAPSQSKQKLSDATINEGSEILPLERKRGSINLPPPTENRKQKSMATDDIIYSTSFEPNEGFSADEKTAVSDWRTLSGNEFEISTANPNSGSNHLRMQDDGTGNTQYTVSPFLGLQPFGNYEVSFAIAISGANAMSGGFDVRLYDNRTGRISSALFISSGDIGTFNSSGMNSSSGVSATPSVYTEIKIRYNKDEEVIQYYANGNLIAENGYYRGFTPDELWILHYNQESGTILDIDDVEVKRLDYPYSWLSLNSISGTVPEDDSFDLELNFNTVGIDAGTYSTRLKLLTNDPENPEIEVPIVLTVNTAVSNEEQQDVPQEIKLKQNYPNPFNPSTRISFELAKSEKVTLEVYNTQGQKVATLLNENRPSGIGEVTFNAGSLSSGVYIYKLKTPSQTLIRKMVLIK
jgi:hypothetical protein